MDRQRNSSKLHTSNDTELARHMEQLDKQINEDSAHIGVIVGDIFKFLTAAMAQLPDIEVRTDMLHLKVDDSGILVRITHPDCKDCHSFDDAPKHEDYDNDEEGLLYDED